MFKILTADQIKELDAHTMVSEPVRSIDLMERACREFVSWFTDHYNSTLKTGIICGTGNNGGDGLGIARLLNEKGYPVTVWIVRGSAKESNDFRENLKSLKGVETNEITASSDKGLFSSYHVLLDGIFGSGLSKPVEGIYAQVISCMNQANAIKIAIDIPSGLFADGPSTGAIVKAKHTVSFQLPKLSFLFPENHPFVGDWHMVNIGLDRSWIEKAECSHFYFTQADAKKLIRHRSKFDHKGTFGHALLIAGSRGKMGAAILASKAALRVGAGLVTTHIPQCGYEIIQSAVPEAMASIDAHASWFSCVPDLGGYSSIGIGPGLGKQKETVESFAKTISSNNKPIVLDADALNILGEHREFINLIPAGSILTPHPGEFSRLAGECRNSFERLDKQKKLAKETKSIVVVKGGHTAIATQDGRMFFNSSGNPGMATGGSGDVLTGILTGLLAQGYAPLDAALLGVFLHGLAGDCASQHIGAPLIASDLINHLPNALGRILQ